MKYDWLFQLGWSWADINEYCLPLELAGLEIPDKCPVQFRHLLKTPLVQEPTLADTKITPPPEQKRLAPQSAWNRSKLQQSVKIERVTLPVQSKRETKVTSTVTPSVVTKSVSHSVWNRSKQLPPQVTKVETKVTPPVQILETKVQVTKVETKVTPPVQILETKVHIKKLLPIVRGVVRAVYAWRHLKKKTRLAVIRRHIRKWRLESVLKRTLVEWVCVHRLTKYYQMIYLYASHFWMDANCCENLVQAIQVTIERLPQCNRKMPLEIQSLLADMKRLSLFPPCFVEHPNKQQYVGQMARTLKNLSNWVTEVKRLNICRKFSKHFRSPRINELAKRFVDFFDFRYQAWKMMMSKTIKLAHQLHAVPDQKNKERYAMSAFPDFLLRTATVATPIPTNPDDDIVVLWSKLRSVSAVLGFPSAILQQVCQTSSKYAESFNFIVKYC